MNETITEEERIKAIPNKEMSAAIKSMNEYLAEQKLDLIVVKDTTKAQALDNLLEPITAAIEADEAGNLPEDVIAFFNDHLAVAEPEPEKPKKPAKTKKEKVKKEPKPKKLSNEQVSYDMVKAGKTDADILKHFEGVYAGKGKDAAFIAKRAAIYTNIAKRKFASEDPAFAKTWAAEKEAAKPKKEPKPKKEKTEKKPAAKKPAAKKPAAKKPAAKK